MADVFHLPQENFIKRLHQEFVSDLKKVCVKEAKLLGHEKELIKLIIKYQRRIIIKPFLKKVKWGYPIFHKGPKPSNYYSKVLGNFCALMDLLRQNLRRQAYIFGMEMVNAMGLVMEEKTRKELAQKIVSIFEKSDKKTLKITTDISNTIEEIYLKLSDFINDFHEVTLQLKKDVPPGLFLNRLRLICSEIDKKNRLINHFRDLSEKEEELNSLIIQYDIENYPLIK